MEIKRILKNTKVLSFEGNRDAVINGIAIDSREVRNGSLFVAQKGVQSDGHLYIGSAIENGACAVVAEQMPEKREKGVAYIQVEDSGRALAEIASLFYGEPSKDLKLVGVTGTNGKTTVATLLYRLFRRLGYKTGLISTVSYIIDDEEFPSTHTTPDAVRVNKMLREMADKGCAYCFMEVSSHSVVQNRIHALEFAGGIFTNLTHDHLDYHKTAANYIQAKKGFFDMLPKEAFAVYNKDDRNGEVMVQNTKARKVSYALKSVADHKAKIVEQFFEGTLISIDGMEVCIRLVGRFNVYNMLAIYTAALELGVDKDVLITELSILTSVSGRFECYNSADGTVAIVDYAHTPDALNNILQTVADIRRPDQKVYCVVGCGGNRDKTKRPVMARAAVDGSDFAIITSDNPRFEKPEDIIADMVCGIKDDADLQERFLTVVDRAEAIKTAFLLSRNDKNPIIVIAGKGHEKYQDVCGVKTHFDDAEQVLKHMKKQ